MSDEERFKIMNYAESWKSFIRLHPDLLGIDCFHLDISRVSDNSLFNQLVYKPDDALIDINSVLKKERDISTIEITNHPRKIPVRDVRVKHIGMLISIEGIIRKLEDPRPKMYNTVFRCTSCRSLTTYPQTERSLEYPDPCLCGRGKWKVEVKKCKENIDAQYFRIQEPPETLKGGEAPSSMDIELSGRLCGSMQAGERVIVTGVYRTYQAKKDSLLLGTYLECMGIEHTKQEYTNLEITDEDEKKILEMKDRTDLHLQIAPSIYGYETLKEAISLHLFGGVTHEMGDGTRKRGDIHILIVGDPGISKSQILRAVHKVSPRSLVVSGRGSSQAGLTCTAVQSTSGEWTLEAGAVVLANDGELCIDEVDKMRVEDRSSLHEAMEQGHISVAKAGITTTLPARCSILAAANPKLGRFPRAEYVDIAEHIDMPPTLLSRFDLIFLLRDKPDSDKDTEIARFIIDKEMHDYDPLLFRKYIAYAKKINPKISPEAKEVLIKYYSNIRSLSKDAEKPMPLTARQFEALVRLTEASARSRLCEVAEEVDATRAIKIIDECLKGIAYDPKTGQIDIDSACGRPSSASRDMIRGLMSHIRKGCEQNGGWCTTDYICTCTGWPKDTIDSLIDKARNEGLILQNRDKLLKVV